MFILIILIECNDFEIFLEAVSISYILILLNARIKLVGSVNWFIFIFNGKESSMY